MILGLQGQFISPQGSVPSVYEFDVVAKDKFMEEISVISNENVYQMPI